MMAFVPDAVPAVESLEVQGLAAEDHSSGIVQFWRLYQRQVPAMAGLVLLALMILVAVLAPRLAPASPTAFFDTFANPGRVYLLGTDHLGRDILSMMIWGTRISLMFAFVAAGISLVIGVGLGAIPGYYGGWIDDLFSRFFDVFIMIPRLFLIILLVALFGSNVLFAILVIGLTIWPSNAKIMRAQVLTLKERGYVHASRVAGRSSIGILLGHVIPNGLGPVIANSTLQMAYAVLTEASLSFLGLGDPNTPSWGQVLNAGQNYIQTAWWMVTFPGVALMMLLLALHLVGDGVSLVLNPRLRAQGEL
jgi:peptide/nickel transport system permease protein